MTWTPNIENAILKASILHDGQTRKGTIAYPYISHLCSVLVILSEYTDDEEVLIAGILHDTVEDSDYTLDHMEVEFGKRVRDIVEGVTMPYNDGVKRTWKERRELYLQSLKDAPKESSIVAAADKIHNFTTAIGLFTNNPDSFKKNFGGSIEERIATYQEIVDVITERIDGPLRDKLIEVFNNYKNFLNNV